MVSGLRQCVDNRPTGFSKTQGAPERSASPAQCKARASACWNTSRPFRAQCRAPETARCVHGGKARTNAAEGRVQTSSASHCQCSTSRESLTAGSISIATQRYPCSAHGRKATWDRSQREYTVGRMCWLGYSTFRGLCGRSARGPATGSREFRA